MRIHYLQHVPAEGLGAIAIWANRRSVECGSTRFFSNDALPELDDFDWLIIMGGPMNIYEEGAYPWFVEEKRFIRQAIEAGKVVLGFCLGGQLIADALGARVARNPETEIGWFELQPVASGVTPPLDRMLGRPLMGFHWHGDRFDLPEGARLCARSEACAHQGFSYEGRVYAFQFHAEATPEVAAGFIATEGELPDGAFVQRPESMLTQLHWFEELNRRLFDFLDGLLANVVPSSR